MTENATSCFFARVLGLLAVTSCLFGCALFHLQETPTGSLVSITTESDRVSLYVEESGQGPPVILVHGFGVHSKTWRRLRSRLDQSFRTITIDLRGAGRSDKPYDQKYTIEHQASLLAGFIRERGLRQVNLIGHSLGGAVALSALIQLQADRQTYVRRLVLMNGAAYPQELPGGMKILAVPGVVEVALPEVLTKGLLMSAYEDPLKIDRQDIYSYARPLYEPGGKHALVTTLQYLAARRTAPRAKYRMLHNPTLLLWCENDPIVPNWVGNRLRDDLPNARMVTLAGCAHVPHEEQPDRTASVVTRFLR